MRGNRRSRSSTWSTYLSGRINGRRLTSSRPGRSLGPRHTYSRSVTLRNLGWASGSHCGHPARETSPPRYSLPDPPPGWTQSKSNKRVLNYATSFPKNIPLLLYKTQYCYTSRSSTLRSRPEKSYIHRQRNIPSCNLSYQLVRKR